MSTAQPETNSSENEAIVRLILDGDPRGEELLYETFHRPLRYLAARYCPQYAEDVVHDTIVAVLPQIKRGQLENAAALPGYLKIILKRTAWNTQSQARRRASDGDAFDFAVQTKADDRADPGRELEAKERAEMMQEGLRRLKPQQREILMRFYLNEERPEFICQEMSLSETQFRLLKSRSKQTLEESILKARKRKPIRMEQQARHSA